ncbi:MAG: GDP-mannose 4,6-dehydratase, partial [bacterium]
MRYLVTGGAGFIGSHLADALRNRGNTLALFDDLSTGNLGNIDHLLGKDGVTFNQG